MSVRDDIERAMQRLLNGQHQYTDGRLTKKNLALEAGVGRATLYRSPDLMAEWDRQVVRAGTIESTPSAHATIARLTAELDDERRRRREAERVTSGLAVVVAELYRTLEEDRHTVDPVTSILPGHHRGIRRK